MALNQFSRTQLLLGQESMDLLADATVAVFGIGGVGGYTVEALARSGVGHFVLVDDDKVCLTNINRQIIATRSSVGKYKVDVMKERIQKQRWKHTNASICRKMRMLLISRSIRTLSMLSIR